MSDTRTHCNCPPGRGYTYHQGEGWRNWCEQVAAGFAVFCFGCSSVCSHDGEGEEWHPTVVRMLPAQPSEAVRATWLYRVLSESENRGEMVTDCLDGLGMLGADGEPNAQWRTVFAALSASGAAAEPATDASLRDVVRLYRYALMHAAGWSYQEAHGLLVGGDFDEDLGGECSCYIRFLRDAVEDLAAGGRDWAALYLTADLEAAEDALLSAYRDYREAQKDGGDDDAQ
jgi:hypothetical protein